MNHTEKLVDVPRPVVAGQYPFRCGANVHLTQTGLAGGVSGQWHNVAAALPQ